MLSAHILKKGCGLPLVFLHGFLGSSKDWEAVCAHLPNRLCIGIDLPGHGDCPFTENFIEEFPLFQEKIHLIGYSMGGRLAAQFAARFPERLASLTLCSTHLGLPCEEEKKKRIESDEKWAENLLRLSIDEFLTSWYDQPVFSGFKPMRTLVKREQLAKALLHYSLGKQSVLSVNAKMLVGERDAKFRALYPTAQVIPNAGHAIHLENPRAVAENL